MKLGTLFRGALAAALITLGLAAPAATLKTPATPSQLIAQIFADLPTNGVGQITAAIMRTELGYIVNSMAYLLQAAPGQILVGNSIGVLTPVTLTGSCTISNTGVISCPTTLVSVTNSPTIGPSNCSTSYNLGGGANYNVSLAAAASFPSGCAFNFTNIDGVLGKTMVISGLATQQLYPQVSWHVVSDGSAWRITGGSPSAKIGPTPRPASFFTLYASPSGNDNNDCLSSGSPCTLTHVCALNAQFDNTAIQGRPGIQLADGVYTELGTTPICTFLGNGPTAALGNILGNCTTPDNVILQANDNGIIFFTKDLGEVEIECVKVVGGNTATAYTGAQFTVGDIIDWDFGTFGTNGVHIAGNQSASINLAGPYSITGNFGIHISVAANANIVATSGTVVTIPSSVTFNDYIVNDGAFVNFGAMSFTGTGASTSVGTHFVQLGGCMYTGGTNANTFFPGNNNGAVPVSECTDWPKVFHVADIPCNGTHEGQEFAVSDSNTVTWGATIAGSSSSHVLGYCDGTNLTVSAK